MDIVSDEPCAGRASPRLSRSTRKRLASATRRPNGIISRATGAYVEPTEIAAVVSYLCSPRAHSITGQFIGVDKSVVSTDPIRLFLFGFPVLFAGTFFTAVSTKLNSARLYWCCYCCRDIENKTNQQVGSPPNIIRRFSQEGQHEMDYPASTVKVDRVACPWLIKKFVDKDAEFFFVPADKVMDEANAIPYVKNVQLGHHGKECSFEAILKKYTLATDPALDLGKIAAVGSWT